MFLVSPDKTKNMRFSVAPSRRSVKRETINGVTYEGVAEFIYLGMLISNGNYVEEEIQRRILAGNRTYFAAIRLFSSRLLSRGSKILLYDSNKTGSVLWSGNMDDDEERGASSVSL
jgi:hypothetical protein